MSKPKMILVVLFLWLFSGLLSASGQDEYVYYVPHVVKYPEYYWSNHASTVILINATEDGTDYELDLDGDGVYENQVTGMLAGSYDSYYCTNWPSPQGTLATGASVRSNFPVELSYRISMNHFGTYDSGFMITDLRPVSSWGDRFMVGADSGYLYIFAASGATVTVTPPGQSPSSYSIAAGTNVRLLNPKAGTTIDSSIPVYVLGVNCQSDQHFPWMYNVLPLSAIGNDYYHDSNYGEVDLSTPIPTLPKLWLTATTAGTVIHIDENKDSIPDHSYTLETGETAVHSSPAKGSHIWSAEKFYVVHTENWAVAPRGKYGGAATEYIPSSSYGKKYGLFKWVHGPNLPDTDPHIFIVAAKNNTRVDIDFGWDGSDITNTLDAGNTWLVNWPVDKSLSASIISDKAIQVVLRSDFAHHDHPGVNVAFTPFPLDIQQEIEAAIDIHPDTLNRKSKGKWVTAYIQLPEGYDPEDIAIDTVMISAIDDNPVAEPLLAASSPTGTGDYNGDCIADLMVKFDRKTLIRMVSPGNCKITVTGALNDDTTFIGSDTVKVIH